MLVQVRQQKYDFDEGELKPYLPLVAYLYYRPPLTPVYYCPPLIPVYYCPPLTPLYYSPPLISRKSNFDQIKNKKKIIQKERESF